MTMRCAGISAVIAASLVFATAAAAGSPSGTEGVRLPSSRDGRRSLRERPSEASRDPSVAVACQGLDVRAFGAVGDDRTDDAPAVDAALRAAARSAGATLCFPAGSYYLGSSMASRIERPLRIVGAGGGRTVLRGNVKSPRLDDALMRVSADISVRGMAFQDLDGIIVVMRNGSRIERIEIVENYFSNVGSPLHWQDENERSSVASLLISNNSVRQAHRGFVVAPGAIGSAHVENNDIESVRFRAIQLGRDDVRSQTRTGRLFVRGNTIADVRERERCAGKGCEAIGVQVQGEGCFVTTNHITRVTNSTDQDGEGIYVKCRSADVSGNVLVDAGHREGYINIKGDNRAGESRVASKPKGFGVTVRGNHLRCEKRLPCRGIHLQTDDVVVSANVIDGEFETAVYTAEAARRFANIIVAENIIRQRGGDKVLGFQHGGRGLQITANSLHVRDATIAAVYIAPAIGESLDQIVVRDNLIDVGGLRGRAAVLVHARDGAGIGGLSIVGNDVAADGVGILLSGSGQWGAVSLADNQLSGVDRPTDRLIVDTPSPFASLAVRDNAGVRLRACGRVELSPEIDSATVHPGLARVGHVAAPGWVDRFTITAVGAMSSALLHWVEPLDDDEGAFTLRVAPLPHETLSFAWCVERGGG